MKEITLKAHVVNGGDPEHLIDIYLSTYQLDSLADQRAAFLEQNIPIEEIEVVIEIPQVVATLFGHKCRMVVK